MLFRALFTSLWTQKYFRSSFLYFRKDYLLNTDSLLQIKLKKKRRLEKREVYAEKNRQIYLRT